MRDVPSTETRQTQSNKNSVKEARWFRRLFVLVCFMFWRFVNAWAWSYSMAICLLCNYYDVIVQAMWFNCIVTAAVRGEDDSSATETEDETKNEAHDSSDNANNRLYIPNKRPHPSGSPDRISAKRQLTRSHRNEKIKKELRSDKQKRNDADKQVKRKKVFVDINSAIHLMLCHFFI